MIEHEYAVHIRYGRMSSMVPGLLAGHHTGRIHSLFCTSLNLQFGERLVHMGTEEHGLCCFGVTVGDREMKLILEACREDNLVIFKKNGLYLYGVGRLIVLELEEFEVVDLTIPNILTHPDLQSRERPSSTEKLQAEQLQTEQGKTASLMEHSILYRELELAADLLELGVERNENFVTYSRILAESKDLDEIEAAVRFFCGRGQGLTPGGDDILVGYGAVLQAFGKAEEFVRVLQRNSLKTTDVSSAYLTAMMEGFANEIFCDIILQILHEEVLKLRQLLCRMEKIGNTSGRDTIYGMYLGFRKIKEAYIV